MRELWAKRIVIIIGALVLVLASLFSYLQNTNTTASRAPSITVDSEKEGIAAGREIFQQQGCETCHSIAGKGNPRNPLDYVGDIHSSETLRDYVIGANHLQNELPEHIYEWKQAYKLLSADELNSLVIYMQSLSTQTEKTNSVLEQ